ncbi:MAG: ferritin-like domain-containing protein [Alphaproteobacteria bacterium]|nr:ferritin-like domain-containing protein [Alphaproteobacteria bacterium]
MADFLSNYSIQRWLESCPQGYLENTVYGHGADEHEPDAMLDSEMLRESEIRSTVQLIAGERCALAASSGLINSAPDQASKAFLATQTLDEGRHVEIFTQRLFDLGVKPKDLESTITTYLNPHLAKFAEVLLEKVDKKDFIAGVVGQNIVLEGMAFSVFEMLHASHAQTNPKFAHTLSGTIADERRHVGFGENRIGDLIRRHPERKADVERMQRDMSKHMLATFHVAFAGSAAANSEMQKRAETTGQNRSQAIYHGVDLSAASTEEMEKVLANTVLGEFKTRLSRIGLEYQSPL